MKRFILLLVSALALAGCSNSEFKIDIQEVTATSVKFGFLLSDSSSISEISGFVEPSCQDSDPQIFMVSKTSAPEGFDFGNVSMNYNNLTPGKEYRISATAKSGSKEYTALENFTTLEQ